MQLEMRIPKDGSSSQLHQNHDSSWKPARFLFQTAKWQRRVRFGCCQGFRQEEEVEVEGTPCWMNSDKDHAEFNPPLKSTKRLNVEHLTYHQGIPRDWSSDLRNKNRLTNEPVQILLQREDHHCKGKIWEDKSTWHMSTTQSACWHLARPRTTP